MKQIFVLVLFSSFLYAQSVTVALAANVSYAMDELKTAFNKHHYAGDLFKLWKYSCINL